MQTVSTSTRNIKAISELEHSALAQRSLSARIGDAIATHAGKMWFIVTPPMRGAQRRQSYRHTPPQSETLLQKQSVGAQRFRSAGYQARKKPRWSSRIPICGH
jgi:hypothetical protein